MIFDEKHECMPLDSLRELQEKRLRAAVKVAYEKVAHYKRVFDENRLKPEDIKTLDDLDKIPFTYKNDLRDNYPFGMLAVPLHDVAEIHASSGTTGNPTVVAYTKNDIALWSHVMARTFACAGATPNDIVQNAYGYGLFTGGLGFHYGALELGASIVPTSSGQTKRQLKLIQDFGSTVITCTPSYSVHMAEEAMASGIDPRTTTIRLGILGAEPWSEEMRREIEEKWAMDAIDIYGLSEIIGPGVAVECPAKNGLHLFSDHFFPEIINPETGERLPDGGRGELVLTTLTKEALPLLRFRVGDITSITHEPCEACGRTMPRIAKIFGRTDDMLIVRGINVFPSQIESVLLSVEGAEPHYLIVVDRERGLDRLEIQVEVSQQLFTDEVKGLETLRDKISDEIENVLGVKAAVKLVEPQTIERSMGKAKRVIDNRRI
ncbi:MAG: phenylacetate--CoA ligase [bacterium]|nr:phenylacetate--CoA ligase [bacterium]